MNPRRVFLRARIIFGAMIVLSAIGFLPLFASAQSAENPILLNNKGIEEMNAGNFKESIRILQHAAEIKPGDTLILQNLAMAMNNLAVSYLADTQPDKAIRWLMQSAQLSPSAVIQKNLCQAMIMKGHLESADGRPDLAIQLFRDAVALDSASPDAHEALGRELYSEGRLKEALDHIEDAYALERKDDLKKFAYKIQREMEEEHNFFEKRSTHYQIFFSPDITQRDISRAVWMLEKFFQEHRMFLGDAPKNPMSAVFYSTKDRFARTLDLTSNVVGFYDGKVRMPLPDKPNWDAIEKTLSHEIAHAFLFELGGANIPGWLNEGLAELMSAGVDRPTPALSDAIRRREKLIPARDISAALRNLANNPQAALAYDEAFSVVRMLHSRYGIFGIRRLLAALKEGKAEEEALQQSLYLTPDMLQQAWDLRLR